MGYVDQADQLRATNPGLRRVKRGGWHALWNFILNVTLVNSFLLSDYKEVSLLNHSLELQLAKFNRFVGSGSIYRKHYLKEVSGYSQSIHGH
jgi:hypothetical protein